MKPYGVIPFDPDKGIPMAPVDRALYEIDRIRECVESLDQLPDWDARQRVLRYLCSRYYNRPAETQTVGQEEK